ncbi:MAG: hypothetical protein GAK31_00626 [Stenotrophomonas maltophilia]|uniref:Uncharacterized protein n=1 Tax=Stenotrophomonas maltophilia TaxID=40324 RepID=A0A7V8FJW5_STEMA|nr:MAG: hypothetical protein GAK31_00626 [Stenotrophomonas maltophilia]
MSVLIRFVAAAWRLAVGSATDALERPWKVRPCSSYQAGRAGIEAWACRHHERLVLESQRAARLSEATTIRFLQTSLHKPRAKDPMKAWVHSAIREVAPARSGRER